MCASWVNYKDSTLCDANIEFALRSLSSFAQHFNRTNTHHTPLFCGHNNMTYGLCQNFFLYYFLPIVFMEKVEMHDGRIYINLEFYSFKNHSYANMFSNWILNYNILTALLMDTHVFVERFVCKWFKNIFFLYQKHNTNFPYFS